MWPCATGSETENRNWTGQYRDHNSKRPRAARCAINVCGMWVLPTGRHSGSGRRTPWQLQQPQPQPDPTVGSAFDPRPQQPGIPGGRHGRLPSLAARAVAAAVAALRLSASLAIGGWPAVLGILRVASAAAWTGHTKRSGEEEKERERERKKTKKCTSYLN